MTTYAAAQGSGAALSKVGDSWTYRYSDGYGKSGMYTVTVWYAPTVKRFVKLTFAAHVVAGGIPPRTRTPSS